jgi:magnesium chelatase family protein
LMDRFDIQAGVNRLGRAELLGAGDGEPSAAVRRRVERARALQAERYGSPLVTNASAPRSSLDASAALTPEGRRMLGDAIDALKLSGRGLDRVRRLARTIADLEGCAEVTDTHLGEALMFRTNDAAGEAA